MSKLNGKKPFRGKYYQNKEEGFVAKVIGWEEQADAVCLEREWRAGLLLPILVL